MGANMVRRLMDGGHECVGLRRRPESRRRARRPPGRAGRARSRTFVAALERAAARVDHGPGGVRRRRPIASLAPLLEPGDTIIDGGNSWYRDDVDRAEPLAADHGIDYVDVGTSGGMYGLERGYCLMVGGDARRRRPPGADLRHAGARRRRRRAHAGTLRRRSAVDGRAGLAALRPERRRPLREDGPQRHRVRADGRLRRGPQRARQGQHRRRARTRRRRDGAARPTPSTTGTTSTWPPIAEVWRRGSVVASWLLDLTAEALAADPELDGFAGNVSDSRRGPLDDQRRHRRGGAGARAVGRAVRAVQLPGPRRRRRQGAVGDARTVSAATSRGRTPQPMTARREQ